MDIPLQNIITAPAKAQQSPNVGAVIIPKEPAKTAIAPVPSATPSELGTVAAVNASRISGQNPTIPEVPDAERILKPYGVTMLPRSETTEKLV